MDYKIRAYLRSRGETNTYKYSVDDEGGVISWAYDNIPQPTEELLAEVPQHFIEFASQDYFTRDLYTTSGTLTLSEWKTFPLTAARFPCISIQENPETISIDTGFWKLTLFGESTGDAVVRITSTEGNIHRTFACSRGQFDCARAIQIPRRMIFKVEARKSATETIQLNITLLLEEL